MKVVVDLDLCQSHGQCVFASPETFQLTDEGLVWDSDPDSTFRQAVEEAVDCCPVQAIRIRT